MTDEQRTIAAAAKLDELWRTGEYRVLLTEACGLTAPQQLIVVGWQYVAGEWVRAG